MITHPEIKDIPVLKRIWKEVFLDIDAYIDLFFEDKFSTDSALIYKVKGKIGLDDRRVELARVMDRFPQELQVHLEPSDISEVTSRRVLEKHREAEVLLHKLYEEHRSRLADCTRATAEIKLPVQIKGRRTPFFLWH